MSGHVTHPAKSSAHGDTPSPAQVVRDFKAAVNMSASALEAWLKTDDSKRVGWTHEGEGESVGHQSGRHIVRLLHHSLAAHAVDEDDVAHMRKVVGYVHRHLAQRPKSDVENSDWRYSLMNWGHDPLKD